MWKLEQDKKKGETKENNGEKTRRKRRSQGEDGKAKRREK